MPAMDRKRFEVVDYVCYRGALETYLRLLASLR